jgi:nucleoside diphosphate kinase
VTKAQLEAGTFPTSYIPTTTASVVCSADVCSITGGDFSRFYNQPEGTLFASGIVDTVGVSVLYPVFLNLNNGTTNNRIVLGSTNSNNAAVRAIIINSGANVYSQLTGTVSAGQSRKVALAYKESDYRAAANSQLTPAGTTGSPPSGLNRADINSSYFVGTISAISYYKKRLSNAKLQTLTTL